MFASYFDDKFVKITNIYTLPTRPRVHFHDCSRKMIVLMHRSTNHYSKILTSVDHYSKILTSADHYSKILTSGFLGITISSTYLWNNRRGGR